MSNTNISYKTGVTGHFLEANGKRGQVKFSEASQAIEKYLERTDLWKEYENLCDLRDKLRHLNFSKLDDKKKAQELRGQAKELLRKVDNAIYNTKFLKKEKLSPGTKKITEHKFSSQEKRQLHYEKMKSSLEAQVQSKKLAQYLPQYFGDQNPYATGSKSLPKAHKLQQEYNKQHVKDLEKVYGAQVVKEATRTLSRNTQEMLHKGFQMLSPTNFETIQVRCQELTAQKYGMSKDNVKEILDYGRTLGGEKTFLEILTQYLNDWHGKVKTIYGEDVVEAAIEQKIEPGNKGERVLTFRRHKMVEQACIAKTAKQYNISVDRVEEIVRSSTEPKRFQELKELKELKEKEWSLQIEKNYGQEVVEEVASLSFDKNYQWDTTQDALQRFEKQCQLIKNKPKDWQTVSAVLYLHIDVPALQNQKDLYSQCKEFIAKCNMPYLEDAVREYKRENNYQEQDDIVLDSRIWAKIVKKYERNIQELEEDSLMFIDDDDKGHAPPPPHDTYLERGYEGSGEESGSEEDWTL